MPHGGLIINFDLKEGYYKIDYNEGNTEEMTNAEVWRHQVLQQIPPINNTPRKSVTNHTNHTPTPEPKTELLQQPTSRFALAASILKSAWEEFNGIDITPKKIFGYPLSGGRVYDEQLKKFALWSNLINHPNSKIAKQWNCSGINEFGRLFQGYKDIEGMNVLEWIHKSKVPNNKRTTYPRYTVDVRPKKDK